MPEKLIYELPERRQKWGEIVRAIPSNWCGVDGFLTASPRYHRKRRVAENTLLLISREHGIKIHPTGLIDLVLNNRIFEKVSLHEVGYQMPGMNMDATKELLEYYVTKYDGWFTVKGPFCGFNYQESDKFSFQLGKTVTTANQELLPHVSLEWNENYDRRREDVEDIIDSLESLKLKKIHLKERKA